MSDDPKIIRFPGLSGNPNPDDPRQPDPPQLRPAGTPLPPGVPALEAEQQKALHTVTSGMTFICIGIKPTPTGGDFYSAIHGDPTDLRNALPHIYDVIHRAMLRRGLL